MNIIILLKLLFAHIFSDFVLQTDAICEKKRERGLAKIKFLIFHSLIHAILSYLFVAQWKNWIVPCVIFFTHFILDFIKSSYMKERLKVLVIDQFSHVTVIFTLWLFLYSDNIQLEWLSDIWNNHNFWCVIVAYLLILKPTSILLNLFIKRWTPEDSASRSLPNAGKYIGYLERILILSFILAGYIEGVGFLLAAKSVFRFGELNKAKDIKTTEYVLIGTLASFTVAILVGFILSKMMS